MIYFLQYRGLAKDRTDAEATRSAEAAEDSTSPNVNENSTSPGAKTEKASSNSNQNANDNNNNAGTSENKQDGFTIGEMLKPLKKSKSSQSASSSKSSKDAPTTATTTPSKTVQSKAAQNGNPPKWKTSATPQLHLSATTYYLDTALFQK